MTAGHGNAESENPFAVSTLFCDNAVLHTPYASPFDFDLENNLVVCGPRLILPAICVHTGATDDLMQVNKQTEFPSMKLVLTQRSCSVTMSVARSEKMRRTRMALIIGLIGVSGFAMAFSPVLFQERRLALLFPIGIFIACLSLFFLNRWSMPLQLVRYKEPGIYWIRGFSKSFLEQLSMHRLNAVDRT